MDFVVATVAKTVVVLMLTLLDVELLEPIVELSLVIVGFVSLSFFTSSIAKIKLKLITINKEGTNIHLNIILND